MNGRERHRRTRPVDPMHTRALGLALPVLLAACAGGGGGIAPEHPDLSGTWVINLEQSDRPGDQLRRRRPPGAPPARSGSPERERRERMRLGLAAALQQSVAFRIEETDSTIVLTAAEGLRRVFYPDGQEREQEVAGLGDVRVKTRWKGDKLVVERRLEGGVKISETYELGPERRQLFLKLRISGGPRPIEFRRVYDAGRQGG